ncbi:DUF2189 domain-containing protein [Rhizobium sp. L1K21]|uniref:DUF2189 domain-containing protein n=1 Tax=Rhizobium sp. L1K21 TaxID=2954933 RepID=UPI0020929C4D|nr:DUF2189 domain-containing protein [Rhizobium sp. L1K21]MCO6186265.1 DUF2189 domain-containing protein [Rhizobium sp. L1K21]
MAGFHILTNEAGALEQPEVARISLRDVYEALTLGVEDFLRKPSHYVFLCMIYPVAGALMISWSAGQNLLPLIFPLISGFALLGPLIAIGLYDMSRQIEAGKEPHWRQALEVRHTPAFLSIIAMASYLFAVFLAWLLVARGLYEARFGLEEGLTLQTFVNNVFYTETGWQMMIVGDLIGACFALLVLATSVVAFPLLLERDVGAVAAIATSVRATLKNPVPVIAWGAIVSALLVVGMIPFLAGLAITMPILGHATWHLYRKLVPRVQG